MGNTAVETIPADSKRLPRYLSAKLWALAVFIVLALQGQYYWQLHKLRKDIVDLQWSDALHGESDNEITTDVGSIQFLKKGGYSISLTTAKYTGDGLILEGTLGNPTHLNISNLSLKLTATKPLYEYRDDFDKDPTPLTIMFEPAIGEAQTSPISYLGAGMTAPFVVTIPNVKQTKEGIRLVVAFTGERYSY